MEIGLAIFFGLVAVYTVFALWLSRFSVTVPVIFVVVGALIGAQGLALCGCGEGSLDFQKHGANRRNWLIKFLLLTGFQGLFSA